MKTVTSTTFISNDDKEFKTKEECLTWESLPRVYIIVKTDSYNDEIIDVYTDYKVAYERRKTLSLQNIMSSCSYILVIKQLK